MSGLVSRFIFGRLHVLTAGYYRQNYKMTKNRAFYFKLLCQMQTKHGLPCELLSLDKASFDYNFQKIEKRMQGSSKRKMLNIDDAIIKLIQTPSNDKGFALKEYEIEGICVMARNIIQDQPMLLELQSPVQICGDTHGQYRDLLNLFKLFGNPQSKSYLFLGDYVDRGKQSLQCICLLMAYKIKYPNNFFLLRGNHQSSQLNKLYGFYDECKRRVSIKVWKLIASTFSYFPIAAVVSNRIFCVHGGLSPLIKHLSAINQIKRPTEPLANRLVADLLWSDPKVAIEGWMDNQERGISYYYGRNVIDLFLNKNEFDLICRSHQVVEEGYEFGYQKKIITIFSAPNYCGQFTNLGAVLKVNEELMCKIDQFEGQPIPIQKRKRSVTPMKKMIEDKEQVKPGRGSVADGHNLKTRKATKIQRMSMQPPSEPLLGNKEEEDEEN